MRRALSLILVLSALAFGSGFYLDNLRQKTAWNYLQRTEEIRRLTLAENWQAASEGVRMAFALWQHDERWLKCLISHHHTREVNAALLRLDTSISQRWMDEALPAADELHNALLDIYESHMPQLENIL